MKRFIKSLIVITLLLLLMPIQRVFAEETIEEKMNNLIAPEKRYNTMLSPAYLRNTESEERIDLPSGELVVNQTDYVLPGINGLDVKIQRMYKIGSEKAFEEKYTYVAGKWVVTRTTEQSFYEKRYGLGKNVRFSFPTIEVRTYEDGNSERFLHTETGDVYKLGQPVLVNNVRTYALAGMRTKDNVMEEDTAFSNGQTNGQSKYVLRDKYGKKTFFAEDGRILGIKDRYNNTIRFLYESLKWKYNTETAYKDQLLISKIIDTMERETTFTYKYGTPQGDGSFVVEDKAYVASDFDIQIKVPDGKTITYSRNKFQLTENGVNKGFFTLIGNIKGIGAQYYIASNLYTNEKIESTSMDNPVIVINYIQYLHKNKVDRYTYIDGLKTVNTIQTKYKKVESKAEISCYPPIELGYNYLNSDKLERNITYTYTNEPDGTGVSQYNKDNESYLKNEYRYYASYTDLRGVRTEFLYNGLNELLSTTETGSDFKRVTVTTKDENKQPAMKEIRTYNIADDKTVSSYYSSTIENYKYDEYGNLLEYTGPMAERTSEGKPVDDKYTTFYTYDIKKNHAIKSKTWKKDDSSTASIVYDISDLGEVMQEWDYYTEGGVQKFTKIDYGYDSHGNMTSKTINKPAEGSPVIAPAPWPKSIANEATTFTTNYEYGIDADKVDHKGAYLTREYAVVNGVEVSKKYIYEFSTGNQTAVIDERGNRKNIQYDDKYRVKKITFPDGSEQNYDYVDSSKENSAVIYTDPIKNKFKYTFDIFGNLVSYSLNGKLMKTVSYDSTGNKIKEINALGDSIQYQYTDFNLIKKRSVWKGDKEEKSSRLAMYYFGLSKETPLVMTEKDEAGTLKNTYYNAARKPVRTSYPQSLAILYTSDETISTFKYDYAGNLIESRDAKGTPTYYEYDELNRLVKQKNNKGVGKTYSYNGLNLVKQEKNEEGTTTEYKYDEKGRLIEVITPSPKDDGSVSVVSYLYDEAGNKVRELDSKGYMPVILHGGTRSLGKRYEYDCMNRLTATYDANGKGIEYRRYDLNGNATKVVDGVHYNGDIETSPGNVFTYNAMGKITTITDAEGKTTTHIYDDLGNLTDTLEPSGSLTKIDYDERNNPVKITYADGGIVSYIYNGLNFKTSETDQRGNTKSYTYTKSGKLSTVTDPYGEVVEYTYDENDNLRTIKDKGNNKDNIIDTTYYDDNRPMEKKVSLEANGKGEVIYRSIEKFEYDDCGRVKKRTLTGDKDPATQRITDFTYTKSGHLKTITSNDGSESKNYYDANGNLIKVETLKNYGGTTSDGTVSKVLEVAKKEYDFNNRLVKDIRLIDENDIDTSAMQDMSYLRDADYPGKIKLITAFDYDVLGNMTSKYDPRAFINYTPTSTPDENYKVSYQYDVLNRLEKVSWLHNGSLVYKQYEYTNNNKTAEINERGARTEYRYDSVNRLTDIIDAKGNITHSSYDIAGNKESTTSPTGVKLNYIYDKLNRVIMTSIENLKTPGESPTVISAIVYDKKGNVVKEVDALGYLTGAVNDSSEYKRDVNTMYGKEYTYDLANRLIKVVDPVVKSTDPNKFTCKYEYNQFGEKTAETDALLNSTKYIYDSYSGRLTRVDVPGVSAQYRYDKVGNKTSYTDGKGRVVSYTYGLCNALEETTDAEGKSVKIKYDLALNPVLITNKDGSITKGRYDSRNLLLSKDAILVGETEAKAENKIAYAYDAVGNRESMSDVTGTTSYTYDMNNWLETVSKNGEKQLSYTYYDDGNLFTSTDKKGNKTTYFYDLKNRLETVEYLPGTKDASGNITQVSLDKSIRVGYSYDVNGNRIKTLYKGGVNTEYAYDRNNRLVSLVNKSPQGSKISYYDYVYDLKGQQIKRTNELTAINYNYDSSGRVTTISMNGKTINYTYDAAGNRDTSAEEAFHYESTTDTQFSEGTFSKSGTAAASMSDNASTDSGIGIALKKVVDKRTNVYYIYSNTNRLVNTKEECIQTITSGTGGGAYFSAAIGTAITTNKVTTTNTSYSYDPNGNELTREASYSDGKRDSSTKKYDGFNRLIKVENNKKGLISIAEFSYDGDGFRVKKISKNSSNGYQPQTTNYLYDRGKVILETDAGDKVLASYAHGMEYIAILDGNLKVSYYLYNGHGDVVQTVTPDGRRENRYDYDIFGNQLENIEYIRNPIKYSGEFFDDETGLYYLTSRYYDPATARFISEDTYAGDSSQPLTLNRYTYCLNDPINHVDPTGHVTKDLFEDVTHYPSTGRSYDSYGNLVANNTVVSKSGGYSDDVKLLQQLLLKENYNIDVDGYFGDQTEAIVKDFQQRHNLTADGIVGPQTWAALLPPVERKPTECAPPPPDPVQEKKPETKPEKKGFFSSLIDVVQTSLDIAGLIPGLGEVADGINAGIYLLRGDYVNAALSAASMIPFAGMATTGAKLVNKAVHALKHVDEVAMAAKLVISKADDVYKFAKKVGKQVGKHMDDVNKLTNKIASKLDNVAKGLFKQTDNLASKAARSADDALEVASKKAGNAVETVAKQGDSINVPANSKLYNPVEFEGTVKVNGEVRDVSRRVYQRGDIDLNFIDKDTGLTNLQLMKKGRPPIGSDGSPIQLHHLTQQEAGSMVEILESTHQKYTSQLHGLIEDGQSFRNNPILEKQYNNFRSKYWRWRYEQFIK